MFDLSQPLHGSWTHFSNLDSFFFLNQKPSTIMLDIGGMMHDISHLQEEMEDRNLAVTNDDWGVGALES